VEVNSRLSLNKGNKQAMSENNESEFFMTASDNDTLGTNELKRAWYNHVLHTLEKLDSHVDAISSELHKTKEDLHMDLFKFKEDLRKDIENSKSLNAKELEKVQVKVEQLISKITDRLDKLEQADIKNELLSVLTGLKEDLTKDINYQKEILTEDIVKQREEFKDLLDPLKIRMTKMEVKMAMIGILVSLGATAIFNVGLLIAKTYFF
jgi:hypothetical protein